MRLIRPYLIAVAIVALTAAFLAPPMGLARENGASAAAINEIAYAALPPEAQQTLQLIRKGGPYPYQRDGVAFGNYERPGLKSSPAPPLTGKRRTKCSWHCSTRKPGAAAS
jgi:hypothetical protein